MPVHGQALLHLIVKAYTETLLTFRWGNVFLKEKPLFSTCSMISILWTLKELGSYQTPANQSSRMYRHRMNHNLSGHYHFKYIILDSFGNQITSTLHFQGKEQPVFCGSQAGKKPKLDAIVDMKNLVTQIVVYLLIHTICLYTYSDVYIPFSLSLWLWVFPVTKKKESFNLKVVLSLSSCSRSSLPF